MSAGTLPGRTRQRRVVHSASHCLRVLYAFVALPREATLAEISEAAGLNKSTAHRALQTLVETGFVEQDPVSRRYRLGIAAYEVGAAFTRGVEVREVARPVLQELVERVGETATLAVRDGWEAVFIDKVLARRPVAFFCDLGRRLPLHAGAAAKAILAWLPEAERRRYLARPLEALTPHTICDPARLEQELAGIRQQGVAFSHQEVDVGISAVGAPIFGAGGQVVAGMAVAGLTACYTPESMPARVEAVREAAARISLGLGYRPPATA